MESSLGNKKIMARNIQHYMDINGLTRQDVCKAIGVKYTTFTDWVKGNVYPRIDKIELMANYFGISKADLVEDHRLVIDPPLFSDQEIEIIKKMRELDETGINFVKSTIDNEYKRAKRLEEYVKMMKDNKVFKKED